MESLKQRLLSRALKRDSFNIPSVPKSFSTSPSKKTIRYSFPQAADHSLNSPIVPTRPSLPAKQNPAPEKNPFVEDLALNSSGESNDEPDSPSPEKLFLDKKPVSFLMFESYIREVCNEIERNDYVCRDTLHRAKSMVKALDDLTTEIPNLSIYFYNLGRSIINDLLKLKETSDYTPVLNKLLELVSFITEQRYQSSEYPVSRFSVYHQKKEDDSYEEVKIGLQKRLENMTPKNINIIGRVVKENLELKKLVRAYMVLLELLDSSFFARLEKESFLAMNKLCAVPNKVSRITQKVVSAVENEEITEESVHTMQALVDKVSVKTMKFKEKSGVGVILYEFMIYVIKFYHTYWNTDLMDTIKAENPINKSFSSPAKPQNRARRRKSVDSSPKKVDRYSASKKIVSSIIEKRVNTPTASSKSSNHSFKDPFKQQLLENILKQEKVLNKFRLFLQRTLGQKKALKEADQGSLLKKFAEEAQIDLNACKTIITKKVFLDNIARVSTVN